MAGLENKLLAKNYFLRKMVGSGGMATVYQAWSREHSTEMAIKVLHPKYSSNQQVLNLFYREAEILEQVNHPNIVRFYGLKQDGPHVFLILDWIDGMNLREKITSSKRIISLADTTKILTPVTAALRYAHSIHHVYHCDIKPANILLHKDGRVFVTDFGMARIAQEQIGGGTLPYMAPEQLSGGRVDARTDVYALGITLFEILSGGVLPFRGDSPDSEGATEQERIRYEHIYLSAPSIKKFNKGISNHIAEVITVALSKQPGDRYRTTIELRDAFERARTSGPNVDSGAKTFFDSKIQPSLLDSFTGRSKRKSSKPSRPPKFSSIRAHMIEASRGVLNNRSFRIKPKGLTLGRSTNNDVQIKERSVSRHHAILWIDRGSAYIRDENSSLGTIVNGKKIFRKRKLKPGDIIQIGHNQTFTYRPN